MTLARTLIASTLVALGVAGLASAQPATCTVPANCQGFDPALPPSTGNNANGGYLSDVNAIGDPQIVADDFFTGSAGNITSVCFWGRYRTTDDPEQSAATESFRITYWRSDANGLPTNPVSFNVGAGGDAGTTLTRVSTVASVPATATNSVGRLWNVTHPAVAVAQSEFMWVEIAGTSTNAGGTNAFRWLFNNSAAAGPFADGLVAISATNPATYTANDIFAGDMAFCVNVGVAGDPIPLAANSRCENAAAFTLPGNGASTSATHDGDAARGELTAAPFCLDRLVDGPGLWYSFTGNGRRLSLTTCNAATDFDTVLFVYCGSCAGGSFTALNCVTQNDTSDDAGCAGTGDPSSVVFDATAGVSYRVQVMGFEGDEGSFVLTATDIGPATVSPACVSDRCPVDIASVPAANVQTEVCDNGTFDNCNAAGQPNVALGQWYAGNIDGNDRDYWEIPGLAPSTWLRIEYQTEFPSSFGLLSGPCTGTSNGDVLTLIPDEFTQTYCANGDYIGQTDATGGARFVVLTNSNTTSGITCGDNNEYRFRITALPVGSCCEAGTACEIKPQAACNTAAGGTFSLGGTCAPDDTCLPGNTTVVCCRGSTCDIVNTGDCTLTGVTQAGVVQGTGATCNAAGVNTAPCCKADYNKVGNVELLDIFAFLNDWFGNRPYADFNGQNNVDLLDIFAFLTAWFSGPCA